ncbi:PREDICTED: uncharacterized protein LOC105563446 [Vollenhovia emeryi]|uniref:uncharacterized protein LOC105563446 n=1 Tax=Vollenhovia emeryi TaxID=411798 RepID=UPI0005F3E667|nr:PREDICTED: uncharacterized protein LOC105563446 [Vollenhovia emeryi]
MQSEMQQARGITRLVIVLLLASYCVAKLESILDNVLQFENEPGIYYEKIGQLRQTEGTWKLVFRIDVASLDIRHGHLKYWLSSAAVLCKYLETGPPQKLCLNTTRIFIRKNEKLTQLLTRLQTLYRITENKHELVNIVDTTDKTLFGTVDADDKQRINEQQKLIEQEQLKEAQQHAMRHQIRIINGTIGHMGLSKHARINEELIINNSETIENKLTKIVQEDVINVHFATINAAISDLTNCAKDALEYLSHSRVGVVLSYLIPLENIIAELKEAAGYQSGGLHFPFKVQIEQWNTIQKYLKISAYYDAPYVYSILTFPLVAYPVYELLKITPLPIHSHANVFTLLKTTHTFLAIHKENNHYTPLSEHDLNRCIRDNTNFVCDQEHPIYYINENAPCEMQVYIHSAKGVNACEKRQLLSNVTLWIAITEPQAWLYSTPTPVKITIECNNRQSKVIEIKRTGKVRVNETCKITTPSMMLKTKQLSEIKTIQMYIPKYNLTFPNKTNGKISNTRNSLKEELFITDLKELTRLSVSLDEVNRDLTEYQHSVFATNDILLLICLGIVFIVITIVILITIRVVTKRRKVQLPLAKDDTIGDNERRSSPATT